MFTTTQAAELLNLKPAMVRRHCESGALAAVKVGRDWVISQEAIDNFQASRKAPGRPAQAPRE